MFMLVFQQTEDVALLMLLLEDLKPDPEAIKHEEGTQDWTGKFSKFAPAIIRILSCTSYLANPTAIQDGQAGVQGSKREVKDGTPPEDNLLLGKECRNLLKVARSPISVWFLALPPSPCKINACSFMFL